MLTLDVTMGKFCLNDTFLIPGLNSVKDQILRQNLMCEMSYQCIFVKADSGKNSLSEFVC